MFTPSQKNWLAREREKSRNKDIHAIQQHMQMLYIDIHGAAINLPMTPVDLFDGIKMAVLGKSNGERA